MEKKKRQQNSSCPPIKQLKEKMDVEVPNFVAQYEEKLLAAAQLKKEIQKLQRTLSEWLKAVPNKTVERKNGKLKLQDVKTYGPVNRRHIESSLISVMSSNKDMTAEQVKQFSANMVKFIWESRPNKLTTKIVRTFSKKRKRTEDLINAEDSEAELSEEELK